MKDICIPVSEVLKNCEASPHEISSGGEIQNLFHDSRKMTAREFNEGDWFICLKGDRLNGHDYIQDVLDRGVRHLIYEPSQTNLRPAGLQVPDTNHFLARVARLWREKMTAKVAAVTGSNGKTSTKELLYFLLSHILDKNPTGRRVVKNEGSLNNHFGLPFTLLNIKKDSPFAIVELGTNHPGEIKELSEWASPDYGFITSIQKGHIGHFKDQQEIAEEKADITFGMKPKSHLFYHANSVFSSVIENKAQKKEVNLHQVSQMKSNIDRIDLKKNGTFFSYKGEPYFLPLLGEHQFRNLTLAISFLELLAQEKRIRSDEIHSALAQLRFFKNVSGRMELIQKKKITICNDSYNANPSSFEASIMSLSHEFRRNRLVGAFGHMGELGSHEIAEHRVLAELAAKHLKALAFFSPSLPVGEAFEEEWMFHRSKDEILIGIPQGADFQQGVAFLRSHLKEGDCLLIKGSRSTRMERLLRFF